MFSQATSYITDAIGGKNGEDVRQYTIETLTVILVASVQYAFQKLIFTCPNQFYKEYALLLLCGPAALLYCFAVIHNRDLQFQIKGAFYGLLNKRVRSMRLLKVEWKYKTYRILVQYIRCLLAPGTWIVLSLLHSDIYACAVVGPDFNDIPTTRNTTYDRRWNIAKTKSQIIGLCLFFLPVFIITFLHSIKRCFKNNSEFQNLDVVAQHEANHAKNYFERLLFEQAEKIAEEKVNLLLEVMKKSKNNSTIPQRHNEMSYETMIQVRDQIMDTYPTMQNKDLQVSNYVINIFQKELEIFQNIVKDRTVSLSLLENNFDDNNDFKWKMEKRLLINEKSV